MANLRGSTTVAPVRPSTDHRADHKKEKFVAYGLRGPAALKRRCEEIAAEETKAVGYPVSASAVMRKFLAKGCEDYR